MVGFGFTVDMHQVEQLAAKYPGVSDEVVRDTLTVIEMRLEAEVAQRTPKGVGGAAGRLGSIQGEVVMTGMTAAAVMGSPLEYAPVVEMGRRPGQRMPPVAPIALWARRKLGVGADEATSVGFAIAHKIAEEGFAGAHMFEKALKEADRWIMTQINLIPKRIIQRIGG
jgi:hypothetical protein